MFLCFSTQIKSKLSLIVALTHPSSAQIYMLYVSCYIVKLFPVWFYFWWHIKPLKLAGRHYSNNSSYLYFIYCLLQDFLGLVSLYQTLQLVTIHTVTHGPHPPVAPWPAVKPHVSPNTRVRDIQEGKPIAFASKSLSHSQSTYSNREGSSVPCIQHQEVPYLPVRMQIHHPHWP